MNKKWRHFFLLKIFLLHSREQHSCAAVSRPIVFPQFKSMCAQQTLNCHLMSEWMCPQSVAYSCLSAMTATIDWSFPSWWFFGCQLANVPGREEVCWLFSLRVIFFWRAAAYGPMMCCQSSEWAPYHSGSPGALWHVLLCPHGYLGS